MSVSEQVCKTYIYIFKYIYLYLYDMCVGYVFAFLHQYMVKICANNMFSIFFRVTTRILSCLALFHHLMGNLFHRITRASKNAQKNACFSEISPKVGKEASFYYPHFFKGFRKAAIHQPFESV